MSGRGQRRGGGWGDRWRRGRERKCALLSTDDPWALLEADPCSILYPRQTMVPMAIKTLSKHLLSNRHSAVNVLLSALRAKDALRDNVDKHVFIVLVLNTLIALESSPLYAHDKRPLRVAIDLTPRLDNDAALPEHKKEDRFYVIITRWRHIVGLFSCNSLAFGDLAPEPCLIQPVYKHFGVAPTRADIRLASFAASGATCWLAALEILDLWDSDTEKFSLTDPRYSFAPEDWLHWRPFLESKGIHQPNRDNQWKIRERFLARFNPAWTPAPLIWTGVVEGCDTIWAYPSTVHFDSDLIDAVRFQWEGIIVRWHVTRLEAAAEIETALLPPATNTCSVGLGVRDVCLIVLAYVSLDRLPALLSKPLPGSSEPNPHARRMANLLACIRWSPSITPPSVGRSHAYPAVSLNQ